MVSQDGYSLTQIVSENKIVICLPQSNDTISTTTTPVADRRLELTSAEESAILSIIMNLYKTKY